jgi:hypothetical protein
MPPASTNQIRNPNISLMLGRPVSAVDAEDTEDGIAISFINTTG